MSETEPSRILAFACGVTLLHYVGLGIGAIGLGPLMATWGYGVGFTLAGVAGALGTCVSAVLWGSGSHVRPGRWSV